jgi:hypothetical protein
MARGFSPSEKRQMIIATLDKFPGRLVQWGDFFKRLQEDYGSDGLSYTTVYNFMVQDGIADFSGGGAQRPFRRLK